MSNSCEITLEDLLSAQFIAKNIKLSANKKTNILAGNNLTRSYGRGMEYSDSRIYQPGDDVRHIDWRLTARHAKTYTKLFHEERPKVVETVAWAAGNGDRSWGRRSTRAGSGFRAG